MFSERTKTKIKQDKTLRKRIIGRGCNAYVKFVMCLRDMWVAQWYCIFERLVGLCEVVGVELYWKLIAKMMGVVCEVVAGFLHGVVFIGCW